MYFLKQNGNSVTFGFKLPHFPVDEMTPARIVFKKKRRMSTNNLRRVISKRTHLRNH